jgi:hypothetical protein
MKFTVVIAFLIVLSSLTIGAQRRAGGGAARTGGASQVNRNVTSTSVRSTQDVNRNVNRNTDVNRNVNTNVDRNVNTNVNRSVNANADRDIDVHHDIDVDNNYDRWGHPVAWGTAAGVAAGVAGAATRAALGTTVAVLPPQCTTVTVDGIGYSQCGSTWYEPYYSGTTVQYVVVSPPQ